MGPGSGGEGERGVAVDAGASSGDESDETDSAAGSDRDADETDSAAGRAAGSTGEADEADEADSAAGSDRDADEIDSAAGRAAGATGETDSAADGGSAGEAEETDWVTGSGEGAGSNGRDGLDSAREVEATSGASGSIDRVGGASERTCGLADRAAGARAADPSITFGGPGRGSADTERGGGWDDEGRLTSAAELVVDVGSGEAAAGGWSFDDAPTTGAGDFSGGAADGAAAPDVDASRNGGEDTVDAS